MLFKDQQQENDFQIDPNDQTLKIDFHLQRQKDRIEILNSKREIIYDSGPKDQNLTLTHAFLRNQARKKGIALDGSVPKVAFCKINVYLPEKELFGNQKKIVMDNQIKN